MKVLIVDFGDSRPEKIKNIISDFSTVYITMYNNAYDSTLEINPDRIILGGGIRDIKALDAPKIDNRIFKLNIPILGICSGMETMAIAFGGVVGNKKYPFEKGQIKTIIDNSSILFKNLKSPQYTHMIHGYSVEKAPKDFNIIASTKDSPIAAFENTNLNMYGVIFHPEGRYSQYGKEIFKNFILNINKEP